MLPKMLYFHHKGYEEFQPSQADSGGCQLMNSTLPRPKKAWQTRLFELCRQVFVNLR